MGRLGLLTIGSPCEPCQVNAARRSAAAPRGRGDTWSLRTDEPMIGSIMTKECPMCGEVMRMRLAERVDKIPGTQQIVKREYREWNCPECDYFEDANPEELLDVPE
jgi:predicted RNA-binding Zn-ribbon protein involved in translation (DUF1610 family)